MTVYLISLLTLVLGYLVLVNGGNRHSAEILQRPNDVIGTQCGKEIRMGCVAKSREGHQTNIPDIEWWYRESDLNTATSSKRLLQMDREGRVKVHVEEFYVVRSTLIIQDAKLVDEGIYQCRASNSPSRYNPNANVYKHWRIEEAPIRNIDCPEDLQPPLTSTSTVTSTTHVIPTTSYNSTEFDKVITSLMRSTIATTSTEAEAAEITEAMEIETGHEQSNRHKINLKKPKKPSIKRKARRTTVSGVGSPNSGRGIGNVAYCNLQFIIFQVVCAILLTYDAR